MPITSKWIITHDGVSYPAGDVVSVLSVEAEDELISYGIAKRVPVIEVAAGSLLSNVSGDDETALTPAEFSELSAADQKDELISLDIDPASNEPGRIDQYITWYENQVIGNDHT
ncbi:hypothetical protein [Paenibacillus sp. NRS-1760]|uniref:hypothetical protein n=1 Tax=Paenibacillus sp. NRS-1760 TaxID=3233902 RepID=UPI003D2B5499